MTGWDPNDNPDGLPPFKPSTQEDIPDAPKPGQQPVQPQAVWPNTTWPYPTVDIEVGGVLD